MLLDDDFATIVAAVEQGRATFANVRRFLTYHLTDNVAELTPFVVWALSGGQFHGLGVLQILALDIGTDLLPALALGAEAPREGVLRKPHRGQHLLDGSLLRRVFGVLGPAGGRDVGVCCGLSCCGLAAGHGVSHRACAAGRLGAAFSAVVLGQMANVCLPQHHLLARRFRLDNQPAALGAVAAELLALAASLFIPPISLAGACASAVVGLGGGHTGHPAVLAADALQVAKTTLR